MEQPISSAAAPSTNEPVRTHEDVLALISDVERQISRLRNVQALSAEELMQHEERVRRVEARETALHTGEAMLIAREAQLRAMADSLQEDRAHLGDRASELERRDRAAEAEAAAIAAERERNIAEAKRVADEEAVLAALREELVEREARARVEVERHREAVAVMQEKMSSAEAAQMEATESRAAIESEAAALRDQLAHAIDAAAAKEREARDVAEAARWSQESESAHLAAVESRLAETTAELDATRQSLQIAGHKLAALAQSVADQAPQLERGAAAAAIVTEQDRKIRELERRVADSTVDSNNHMLLESRLDDAKRKCDVLEGTIVSLERKLEEAVQVAADETHRAERLAAEFAQSNQTGESDRAKLEKRIEEKSRRFAEMGALLKKRKERLDRAKQLRQARSRRDRDRSQEVREAAMVNALEEERVLKRQREELRHVQDMLAASERRLLERTTRSRTLIAAGWCMLIAGAAAVGSWFAAESIWPVPVVASVDLVAKLRDGEKLSPEADSAWQDAHRGAIKDDAFRVVVQRRLQERGLNTIGGTHEIAAWMDSVRVDSDGPGSLRLVASGPDQDSVVLALDTLATSMANESARLLRAHSELPRAVIAGSTAVAGRVTYASVVPQTAPSDRLQGAAMLFSGVAGLGVAGALVVYSRLARSKRKFEEIGAV